MPDQESAEAKPERDIPVDLFPEAPVSIDLKNPAGWMLHLRSRTVAGLVDKVNELFDPEHGDRSDLTNIVLQSFNPAIIGSMAAGQKVEEALGYEPDDLARDAYEALKAGATRRPAASGGGGGGSSRSSGGSSKDYPDWFDGVCRKCDGENFWDNRDQLAEHPKRPHFKCKDCEEAYWPPKDSGRPRRGGRGD